MLTRPRGQSPRLDVVTLRGLISDRSLLGWDDPYHDGDKARHGRTKFQNDHPTPSNLAFEHDPRNFAIKKCRSISHKIHF